MRLPRFEYLQPETTKDASALLAQPGTKAMAGGTELLVKLKQNTVEAGAIVDLKRLPGLDQIEQAEDGALRIGATTALRTVATSPLVRERCGLLAIAAASVGRPRIPYMATIGGNLCLDSRCFYHNQSRLWKQSLPSCYKEGGDLCHVAKGSSHCNALFVADTVPALLALGAEATLIAADGEARVPLQDFYSGQGRQVNVLRPGQILTQIRVPALPPHCGTAYLRHGLREAIDFAVASAGVLITADPRDGSCRDVRIVLGSVSTGPLRANGAEATLKGKTLDEALVATAAALAAEEAHPLGHLGISAAYKRRLIAVLTKRAVHEAWRQAAAVRDQDKKR
jgi:4-hydroxybenzoyl-CoA reductase subunit beta